MKFHICFLSLSVILASCSPTSAPEKAIASKTEPTDTIKEIAVGGPCDECDLMFEGMPPIDQIKSETTIADKNEPGERMEISGTVVMHDGISPAKDVVLYLYHTDAKGYYSKGNTQTVGKRNGHLRGWVKTDEQGRFKISSIRPAPYPKASIPAHIHILVKEKNKTRYYIDEVWFDDDKFITQKMKDDSEKRGGDMTIHLDKENDVWKGKLKITLGLNIPDYK